MRNFFARSEEARRIMDDRRRVIIVRGNTQTPDQTFARPGATPAPQPVTV